MLAQRNYSAFLSDTSALILVNRDLRGCWMSLVMLPCLLWTKLTYLCSDLHHLTACLRVVVTLSRIEEGEFLCYLVPTISTPVGLKHELRAAL